MIHRKVTKHPTAFNAFLKLVFRKLDYNNKAKKMNKSGQVGSKRRRAAKFRPGRRTVLLL